MPIVKFIKEKKEIEVPEGANLRKEALKADVNPHSLLNGMGAGISRAILNCHGFGQCGTCRVRITKGMENTSPMGIVEKTRFRFPIPTPITPGGLDPLPCLAGATLMAFLTVFLQRRTLARCLDELRRWYERCHGQKVLD